MSHNNPKIPAPTRRQATPNTTDRGPYARPMAMPPPPIKNPTTTQKRRRCSRRRWARRSVGAPVDLSGWEEGDKIKLLHVDQALIGQL